MITNYTTLEAAVAAWINRADLTATIPTFVQSAEQEIRRRIAGAAAFAPLDSAAPTSTNWVLDDHPDVYLYGALLETAPYLVDDARIPVWETLFEKRLSNILRTRNEDVITLANHAGLVDTVTKHLDRADLAPVINTLVTLAEASLRRTFAGREITALSAGSNWLFESHPDVYLYATLLEAAPYLGQDSRLAIWADTLNARVASVLRSRDEVALDHTTYAGLQSAVAKWFDRNDLTPMIPTFIALAENEMFPELVGWNMEDVEDEDAVSTLDPLATAVGNTNWLFAAHPDLYLWASLKQAAVYLSDPRAAQWESMAALRLATLHGKTVKSQFTNSMVRCTAVVFG